VFEQFFRSWNNADPAGWCESCRFYRRPTETTALQTGHYFWRNVSLRVTSAASWVIPLSRSGTDLIGDYIAGRFTVQAVGGRAQQQKSARCAFTGKESRLTIVR